MMSGKIAIDARMLGASGIGTYIHNLLSELCRIEHDLKFVLIGAPDKLRAVVAQHERFEIRESHAPIYSISEQMKLPGLAGDADLLHCPHHNVPIMWRGKLVVTFHDALHWDHPELMPNWRGKIYIRLVSRRIARADGIIVPSKFTAERLRKNIDAPQERIHIIPQGVDRHRFSRRSSASVKAILGRYGIRAGNYLLYVGNMKPHKNIERLAKAYSIARKNGVDIELIIAGKIEGLKRIVEIDKLKSYDGIRYIGEISYSELPYFYSGARAFLFPSLYEGFGLPPLEAMSCGCPVLTSSAASLPEVVGNAAIIADPENKNEMAKKIMKIALDLSLRKKLITNGRERIKCFSWLHTAQKTIEVYRRVLSGKERQ